MEKIRIVIVDDSPFSIAVIRGILEDGEYDVVGEASSLEEVREVVEATRPDLVTMDMTIPGTDGLECTRAVHEIDPDIKVIVVSSMMDDEIVNEARKNRVADYIQKPIDPDELLTAISRLMEADELFTRLEVEALPVFKEALLDGMNRMTKTLLSYKEEVASLKEYKSQGITVIMGITGKFAGRMVVDLSDETALNISSRLLKRQPKDKDEIVQVMAEFTNIVAGNACSVLNRKDKALGLRVAPPSILYGDNVHISAPNFRTDSLVGQTDFGDIWMNIGFTRSDD